jgi:hypothetical protein
MFHLVKQMKHTESHSCANMSHSERSGRLDSSSSMQVDAVACVSNNLLCILYIHGSSLGNLYHKNKL